MNTDTISPARLDSEISISQHADANWAQHDPTVEQLYGGRWVVAVDRKIVAHGDDPGLVLEEAARLTGREPDELVVCGIPSAESWLADA